MKRTIAIIFCLLLCICLFAGCNEPTPPADDWIPKGVQITLSKVGEEFIYANIYDADDESARLAGIAFKDALVENGLPASHVVLADDLEVYPKEILFGATSRKASELALAYLNECIGGETDDLHWVFYYRDGKLALVANSEEAYGQGIKGFIEKYYAGGALIFNDTLKEHGKMSRADYDEILAEQERVEAERLEAIRQQKLAAIKEKLTEQNEALATNTAFNTETADMMALVTEQSKLWDKADASLTADQHPRLMLTSDMLPGIREALKEDTPTNRWWKERLAADVTGILPAPVEHNDGRNGMHNYDGYVLEDIAVKALGYLVYENDLYGYEAIYAMKNYLLTLDIQKIHSDQCREYGNVMYIAACVYDWCYPLLSETDRLHIRAAVENNICTGRNSFDVKMEVGFPPTGQGSVSGHGSEYQILRDYFSFAIAIYDENASWWEYISARVYNDYIKTRNYYFQSGISQQGTGTYAVFRHGADLFSAWIAKVATGENPYVGLENTTRSFLGYEYAPGKIFGDGDGTIMQNASAFMPHAFMTAYLYGDSALLAQAEFYRGEGAYIAATTSVSASVYVIMRGTGLEPSEDRYEKMELIQYNGYPMGQYIIREAWNDPNSCAVFMRIKERTTANHEHYDAGTFNIYYKGMLTNDGGVYDGYGNDHWTYYHTATVAHNGLLIYQSDKYPISTTSAAAKWYTGGQTRMGETSTLEFWLNDSGYDTGKVTGRQHGYIDGDKTKPLYAYIAGDITAAYDDDAVNYVGRRMLTVYTGDEDYPMAFFVYDDIESKKASYPKIFLLQITSGNAPKVDEKAGTVITENGDGRLVLTCLTSGAEFYKLGGREYTSGKYDSMKSSNYLINGRQLSTPNGKDDGHWGRVEISVGGDPKGDKSSTIMNVLYVTDKGNKKSVSVEKISDAVGLEGGVFKESVVGLFATSRERASSTISATVTGGSSMSYYVSGVAAGEWSVTVDGKFVSNVTATEEGGLLTFTAPAGKVVISPVK